MAHHRPAAMFKRTGPALLEDPVVAKVAQALGKSAGQVLIRWAVQRGTSVLPKSVNPARIAGNLDVHSWSIPDDLFEQLNALSQVRAVRCVRCAVLCSPALLVSLDLPGARSIPGRSLLLWLCPTKCVAAVAVRLAGWTRPAATCRPRPLPAQPRRPLQDRAGPLGRGGRAGLCALTL